MPKRPELLVYPWDALSSENPNADSGRSYWEVTISFGTSRADVMDLSGWPTAGTTTLFQGETAEAHHDEHVEIELTAMEKDYVDCALIVQADRLRPWLDNHEEPFIVAVNLRWNRLLGMELDGRTDFGVNGYVSETDRTMAGLQTHWQQSLADERIRAMTDTALGLCVVTTDQVVLIDTDTGAVQWRTDIDQVSGEIAVSDGMVYCATKSYSLSAVDLETGAIRWETDGETDIRTVEMVSGGDETDRVFLGRRKRSELLDPQTGAQLCQHEYDGTGSSSNPAVRHVASDGERLYLGYKRDYMCVVDISSGSVRWSVDTDGIRGQPAVTDDLVIVVHDQTAHGYDPATGQTQWAEYVGGVTCSPLLIGDLVLLAGAKCYALNIATGEQRWTVDLDAGHYRPRLGIASGDTVSQVSATGHQSSDDRQREPNSDYIFYAGNRTTKAAIDVDTGTIRWERPVPTTTSDANIRLDDGSFYVMTKPGELGAFDAKTGELAWIQSTAERDFVVANDRVYIVDEGLRAVSTGERKTTEFTGQLLTQERDDGTARLSLDGPGRSLRITSDYVPSHGLFADAAFSVMAAFRPDRELSTTPVGDAIHVVTATLADIDGDGIATVDLEDQGHSVGQLHVEMGVLPAGMSVGDRYSLTLHFEYDHSRTPPAALVRQDDAEHGLPVAQLPDSVADRFVTGDANRAVSATDADTTATVEWTVDLDGELESAPVVIGDTVYAGDKRESLLAIDRSTGAVEWRTDHGCRYVVAGEGLFVTTRSTVYRYDPETGARQWDQSFDERVRGLTQAGGTLVVNLRDELQGIDPTDGTVVWSQESRAYGGSFRRLHSDSERVYVSASNVGALALDPASGDEEWVFSNRTANVRPLRAASGIYVLYEQRALSSIDPAGTQQWWYQFEDGAGPQTTEAGGRLFVTVGNVLYALRASTGTYEWSCETRDSLTSLCADDDLVMGQTSRGAVYTFDAATGSFRCSLDTPRGKSGSPTVSDGTVYVGDDTETLYALSVG